MVEMWFDSMWRLPIAESWREKVRTRTRTSVLARNCGLASVKQALVEKTSKHAAQSPLLANMWGARVETGVACPLCTLNTSTMGSIRLIMPQTPSQPTTRLTSQLTFTHSSSFMCPLCTMYMSTLVLDSLCRTICGIGLHDVKSCTELEALNAQRQAQWMQQCACVSFTITVLAGEFSRVPQQTGYCHRCSCTCGC